MSVEIRKTADSRNIECDWGVITHSRPYPDLGHVGHLILVSVKWAQNLLAFGSSRLEKPGLASASRDRDRVFYHLQYGDQRWTWELFEAHWWDGKGTEIYVGKWPD